MAETERTFAALQTLLADNSTEAISEQDLRDLMVTALGGYASIYVEGNAVAQALVAAAAVVTAFDTVGPARGMSNSHVANTLTVAVDGIYRVELTASVGGNATPGVVTFELFKGGVKENGFTAENDALIASARPFVFSGLVSLTAADVLDVRARAVPNGNATIRHAHLSAKRVG